MVQRQRPSTPKPKEVIRARTDNRPLGFQYAEVLEDAESKGSRRLLDHVISACEQCVGNLEVEDLGRFEVDYQL
jgi:hypothetical protein